MEAEILKKLILLLMVICLTGCSVKPQDSKTMCEFFSMDTVMTVTVYDGDEDAADAADAVKDEIIRLDNLLSISNKKGDIANLNKNGGGEASEDTVFLLKSALELFESTGGAFDITVYPLAVLWGFHSHDYRVPTEDEVSEYLKLSGSDRVLISGSTVKLDAGMGLDLGGIAKGYASDRAAEILRNKGVQSAMVSLGGNIYALGSNPNGRPWNVGIQHPADADGYIGVVSVSDMAVVTSGTYQRFFESDGKVYHHILDPETGYPSESGLCSVTILCENGTLADGLSTALLVMGLDEALEFWKQGHYDFEAVFVTDDNEIYITSGLEDCFTSNLPYEVVKP